MEKTWVLKFIDEPEYLHFFNLIDSNRERLLSFFPNTVREIQTTKDAKRHLKQSGLKRKRNEKFLFGIYRQEQLIGYVNVKNIDPEIAKGEIGYFMDKAFEGKGIMSTAIKETIDFCFQELKLQKIFLRISKENIGSIKVAERNGFQKEGTLRNEFRLETGELIDVEYYGLVNG